MTDGFHKSTYSNDGSHCVEVKEGSETLVRDTRIETRESFRSLLRSGLHCCAQRCSESSLAMRTVSPETPESAAYY